MNTYRVPFVDSKIFKFALFPRADILPRQILWNNQLWDLRTPWGSTYYAPSKQLALLLGVADPVQLERPDNGFLDDHDEYRPRFLARARAQAQP